MSRSTGTSSSTATTGTTMTTTTPKSGNMLNSRRQVFLDIVRQSNISCSTGDYPGAVRLYCEALKIDPNNHILYSNRSAAYVKMGQFSKALQDALKARDLNPKWAKAYYRQGVALQCLGKHSDALAAFSAGLGEEPKSGQLLSGLIEAATKSPLKGKLSPIFTQLQAMKLDKSAFVVISVIGQELLAGGYYMAAVVVLESALKIGTANLKLKGSVFSALSSAYWALNSLEKAISYMQQDLSVVKSLGDVSGECRAHGNLGSAYFSKANYKDALTSHRYQLVLAMKCKDTHAAAAALTSLGHVYTAIGDYANALASHKQCVQLVKQIGESLQEAREIGNVGAVYLVMGDFDNAIDCHLEHLRLAKELGNRVEEARAYSNLGSSYHYRRSFDQAITFHNHVLQIAHDLNDKTIEARAYAGLGHAARCVSDYRMAKTWHEKQLDMALSTKDKVAEGRACSNLGIVYQLLGDHDSALKLHQAHLSLAASLHDRGGMGRAYGNIGNAYNAMGYYEQAIKYHKQELAISKEVNDRSSEASTHGNLAVAYQALGMFEKALVHYHSHLNISRELKDTSGEACALLNLANCHSSHGDFGQAVPFYENYLMLSQELSDVEGEAKACHFLGYVHYCLGNFKEAVRYYNQDLSLAKDLQHKSNIARAYCNLGLTHLSLGNLDMALECQKLFLTVTHAMQNTQGKFRALGNIGNVMLRMQRPEEAVKVYQKQVLMARSSGDKVMEGSAYGALGLAHRAMKRLDRALGFHAQELAVHRDTNDVKGQCRAQGNLGAVHMSLGNYTNAIKCYEDMLRKAKELKDAMTEAQAYGNLGIARMNMGNYEEASTFLQQHLGLLERLPASNVTIAERCRGYGHLGDCLCHLDSYEEALGWFEKGLQLALKTQDMVEQERAYGSIGSVYRALGNTGAAVSAFEKRLTLALRLDNGLESIAYADLGLEHLELRNFEQAVQCLQSSYNSAKEAEDKKMEAMAASNLGQCFQLMGNFNEALEYHDLDLQLAQESGSVEDKLRALRNIGLAYESLSDFDQALHYQEQHLSVATQTEDAMAKMLAFSSIGRIQHALGNTIQAVAYLRQALEMVVGLETTEEEAKIHHFLGLALWRHGDLESAQAHLEKSTDLLEAIRQSVGSSLQSSEYSLTLFDRQIASYQALQRILVPMGRTDLTLLIAEKSRTIANVLLLQKSQTQKGFHENSSNVLVSLINSVEALVSRVNRHRAAVLYFSIAGENLYSWLLIPGRGIVKFHESCISNDDEADEDDDTASSMGSLLERYIQGTREALGIDFNSPNSRLGLDTEGEESSDLWTQHLEELGNKMNQENDKTGFLRMVSRNHRFNCSSYSLSSVFSVGSATGSVKSLPSSRAGSTRSKLRTRSSWQGPTCLRSLYQLLIAPFEEELSVLDRTCFKELILVVDTDLLLVPFSILRSATTEEYLCEKFKLIVTPSISSIRSSNRAVEWKEGADRPLPLVVGNPALPSSVTEQWGWGDIPRAETEASMVAEILQTEALTGPQASREAVLREFLSAECIHLATHISWKLSAIVLSLPSTDSSEEAPGFSEFLLTAADILKLRMNARLVVLSSCQTKESQGLGSAESVIGLSKALLAAGAMAVLIPLWPVPETASKIFFRALYSSLLQGSRVSHAVSEAMLTVQHTKHFAHPANWSGYLLIGSDVQLTNKVALTGQAIWELLKSPDRSKDALRVTLHLVEKSLQRINNGQKNAMYTTQKSIENKVGNVSGWKEILMSVGFRFEPSSNGLPAAVFFPQSDPGERLVKCSESLQALLGLPPPSIRALSKLLSTPEAGDDVISILRQGIAEMTLKDLDKDKVEIKIDVKLWGIVGCHELLASLGFDLIEVGENEVILGVGKTVSVRMLQLALQAGLSLFEAIGEADENGKLDQSLSLESLELTEEICSTLPSNMLTAACLPMRRQMGMGQGAFTSYVRSRGEPDGHTNVSAEDRSHCQAPYTSAMPSKRPPVPAARAPQLQNYRHSVLSAVQRADSSSSSSSMTDWENGLDTVRRRAGVPMTSSSKDLKGLMIPGLSGFDSQSDSEFMIPPLRRLHLTPPTTHQYENTFESKAAANSKRVSWELNESSEQAGTKPWMKLRSVFSGNKPNSSSAADSTKVEASVQDHLKSSQHVSQMTRELPISEVYHERNMGLDLAPPLSKLLLLSTSDKKALAELDPGTVSMDESLSNFDVLSMAEDSSAESGGPKAKPKPKLTLPPIPMKRTLKGPVKISIATRAESSSSNSSKSSPSDLSRRDEGDGRSLTDSQYGSYSPSNAQNDLIQSASAYFAAKSSGDIESSSQTDIEMSSTSSKSSTVRSLISNAEKLVTGQNPGNDEQLKRQNKLQVPRLNLSTLNQKSSEC